MTPPGAVARRPATPVAAPAARWTGLVGLGLELAVGLRARRLCDDEYWTRRAGEIQIRQLRRLIASAARTRFGREHGFDGLLDLAGPELVAGYRARVPIRDWYGFREMIALMREQGRPDILWPGLVRDFAQTSGTTAGDKFIPVSRAMMRSNFHASMDIFAHLTRRGLSLSWLTAGRSLFMGGSSDVRANEHGVRTGDLSGLVTPMIRWPLSEVYAPGHDIALMDHWPSKIDAMAEACLDMDVRMLSGMPSWAHVLFERLLELARERGRPASCVRDLWPNFVLFVHGGVKYTPFVSRINEIVFGDPSIDFPHRLELYPASEGFIAIQDTPRNPGLRLLTDNHVFFEFVPLDEIDNASPRAFACHEVELGQRYVVVLSTCAGLWRYILGDVVEFDTIPAPPGARSLAGFGPPRLRIVGRHRHFINAFGENLIVEHIENAVAEAAAAAGVTVGEFTAAPIYPTHESPAGLELAIEFEDSPVPAPPHDATGDRRSPSVDQDSRLVRFRDAFDASLKAQNVDYTTKRTDGLGMGPPAITPLPVGAFHRWMQSRGKLGGQHKCPRCANHREIVEGVVGSEAASTPTYHYP
ncbi:MAG: GH3 auxin-responsive promoter family protein [Phycisphaeraceae bacterium]|nr:GH3 auxin-responsive promoter family protein [Phycisphaeraceae bacterium]